LVASIDSVKLLKDILLWRKNSLLGLGAGSFSSPDSTAGLKTAITSVSSKVTSGVVAFSTLGTHEFKFACVKPLVCSQISQLIERFLTKATLVSLFSRVDFLMRFQS